MGAEPFDEGLPGLETRMGRVLAPSGRGRYEPAASISMSRGIVAAFSHRFYRGKRRPRRSANVRTFGRYCGSYAGLRSTLLAAGKAV